MTHMLDMYPNCKWMKDNFHDIFSSLEQEICSLSDTFLYASGSSWSLNIMMERHARNIRKKKASQIVFTISSERKKLGKHRTTFQSSRKTASRNQITRRILPQTK